MEHCVFIYGYNLLAKINEALFMQRGENRYSV